MNTTDAISEPLASEADMPTDDLKATTKQEEELMKEFSRRLNDLLEARGYPTVQIQRFTKLAEDLNASISGVRKWCLGIAIPSPLTLVRMAEHFNVSTDYLLNLRDAESEINVVPSRTRVNLPLCVIDRRGSQDGNCTQAAFKELRTISIDYGDKEMSVPRSNHRFLVENWSDMTDPSLRVGDLLIVETGENYLTEDGIYLLRTQSMLCLRRIIAQMDGRVQLTSEHRGEKESTVVEPKEIVFNKSKTLDEPAPKSGIQIIGRIVAKILKLDSQVLGFR
jgi:transcriptional regulator with XRE-family HTH domain